MGRVKGLLADQRFDFVHRARRRDPVTSHLSAAGSSHKPARYVKVLEGLRSFGVAGGTCYEIAAACGMTHVEVARCMKPLEGRAHVVRTEAARMGPSGYLCTVWRAL